MQPLSVTPEEVLSVVNEMFPKELDRAMAELTIRRLQARVAELEGEVDRAMESETVHGHTHD